MQLSECSFCLWLVLLHFLPSRCLVFSPSAFRNVSEAHSEVKIEPDFKSLIICSSTCPTEHVEQRKKRFSFILILKADKRFRLYHRCLLCCFSSEAVSSEFVIKFVQSDLHSLLCRFNLYFFLSILKPLSFKKSFMSIHFTPCLAATAGILLCFVLPSCVIKTQLWTLQ